MFQLWKAAAIAGVVQVLLSGCANTQQTGSTADAILDGTESYDGPPQSNTLHVAGSDSEPTPERPSVDGSNAMGLSGENVPFDSGTHGGTSLREVGLAAGLASRSEAPQWEARFGHVPEISSRQDVEAPFATVSDSSATAPRLPDSVETVVAVSEQPSATVSKETSPHSDRGWVPTGTRPRTEPNSPSRPQLLTATASPDKSGATSPRQLAQAGRKPELAGGVTVVASVQRDTRSESASTQIQLAGLKRLEPAPPAEELSAVEELSAAEASVPEVSSPDVARETSAERSPPLLPGSALLQTSSWQGVIEPVRSTSRRPLAARSTESETVIVTTSETADSANHAEAPKPDVSHDGAYHGQSVVEFRGSIQSASGGLMASIRVAGSGMQTVREGDQIPVNREGEVRLYLVRRITGSSVLLESSDGQLLASQE